MKSWNVTSKSAAKEAESSSCGSDNCIPDMTGEQACECIEQDLGHRVIPCGTIKLAGQERRYRTTTNLLLTRDEFLEWSALQGSKVDPIVWFTEMGHGPISPDVKV